MGEGRGLRGRFVGETPAQGFLLTQGPSQQRVDETGGMVGARGPGQAHRLVDRRIVGPAFGEEQLEQPEPQGSHGLRGRPPAAVLRIAGDDRVGGSAALDRAVRKLLCGRPAATGEPALLDLGPEGGLGVFVLLEGPAQDRECGRALRRHIAQAAAVGTPRPRR